MLFLSQKLDLRLYTFDWLKGSGEWIALAWYYDDILIIIGGKTLQLYFSEEIVRPAFESIVWLCEIQIKIIWVPLSWLSSAGLSFLDPQIDVFQGSFRIQHFDVIVKNLSEMIVDFCRIKHSLKGMNKPEVNFVVSNLIVIRMRRS